MDTDTITDRVITVDFGMPLADMIAAGKYDWVNPDITAGRFPIEATGTKQFRTKVFDFGRDISSEGAVATMRKGNFTPASHVHGLAFGAAFPEDHRKHPIACLGSFAQVGGTRHVVCLDSNGTTLRDLDFSSWDGVWRDYWHFLGVQKLCDA